ncbi:hypothetical protein SeMB42_g02508 [Synchytrium endobioticum]|uniref:E2 ubiquitin-conjugating enzyme n=2 Tax=Synchytrium endobioticum TaxID=286115 RepID=A0A507DDQ3_9FUNG|nr:hypothetical protein SeMB42_g02508 [Synchytrium endobioticum]
MYLVPTRQQYIVKCGEARVKAVSQTAKPFSLTADYSITVALHVFFRWEADAQMERRTERDKRLINEREISQSAASSSFQNSHSVTGSIMALPKRIVKETERLLAEPAPGISAVPHEDNLRYFDVVIAGPNQSPFEGGVFRLELFLPEEYPMAPPKVRFLTKIYHPNIDKLGRICLDILKDKWSPALQIRTVLLSVQALLSAPNPDDPLANDVAQHWKENEKAAIVTAREWTNKYASST